MPGSEFESLQDFQEIQFEFRFEQEMGLVFSRTNLAAAVCMRTMPGVTRQSCRLLTPLLGLVKLMLYREVRSDTVEFGVYVREREREMRPVLPRRGSR